jgi:hypothetical protein
MGVAEGVGDLVMAVGLPAVVDRHPGYLPDHTEVVHGHTPPPLVAVDQGEQVRGGRVHPVEAALHPTPGLVEVDGRGIVEQGTGGLEKRRQGIGRLGDHLGECSDRHRGTEHVTEQLGHAVHG